MPDRAEERDLWGRVQDPQRGVPRETDGQGRRGSAVEAGDEVAVAPERKDAGPGPGQPGRQKVRVLAPPVGPVEVPAGIAQPLSIHGSCHGRPAQRSSPITA